MFLRKTLLGSVVVLTTLAPILGQTPQKSKRPTPPKPKVPVAATFDSIEISLNGMVQKARIHIVDFGDIAMGQPKSAKLELRNLSDRQLTLDMFTWGDYLKTTWHEIEQAVVTRKLVPPKSSVAIDIELNCTDVAKQRLQLVSLAENSVPVTTLVIAYVAHPPTLVLPIVTGAYQSGLGAKWSDYYTVPSGPAPFGYTYSSDSFDTAGSDPAGNSRNCGFNVDCKKIQADDKNVVWKFSIQGYEHDWSHSDSSVKAQGNLTVVYRLNSPPTPVLKTVEN